MKKLGIVVLLGAGLLQSCVTAAETGDSDIKNLKASDAKSGTEASSEVNEQSAVPSKSVSERKVIHKKVEHPYSIEKK